MPASENRYCIVGIHYADRPDDPEILAVEGQIVVFDTLYAAQSFLPRLFAGRLHVWDAAKEVLYAMEFVREGFNRLSIWTGYDPYDVPNGFRAKGIYSEAAGRDWKYHTPYFHHTRTLTAWADNQEAERQAGLQAASLAGEGVFA